MPLALITIGAVLLISAGLGTHQQLLALLKNDFSGPNNFFFWILALGVVGLLGYIPKMRPLSIGLIALVLISIFLKKGVGFFDQIKKALGVTVGAPPTQPETIVV
jgi:hypothetical protein